MEDTLTLVLLQRMHCQDCWLPEAQDLQDCYINSQEQDILHTLMVLSFHISSTTRQPGPIMHIALLSSLQQYYIPTALPI